MQLFPCMSSNWTSFVPSSKLPLLLRVQTVSSGISGPASAALHTDAFDRQIIRIPTQRGTQSRVITSADNWPADSDMILAPVVTCLNNEITIEWQTRAPPGRRQIWHVTKTTVSGCVVLLISLSSLFAPSLLLKRGHVAWWVTLLESPKPQTSTFYSKKTFEWAKPQQGDWYLSTTSNALISTDPSLLHLPIEAEGRCCTPAITVCAGEGAKCNPSVLLHDLQCLLLSRQASGFTCRAGGGTGFSTSGETDIWLGTKDTQHLYFCFGSERETHHRREKEGIKPVPGVSYMTHTGGWSIYVFCCI